MIDAGYLGTLGGERLAALLRARPDVLEAPQPSCLDEVAHRLAEPCSVVTALRRLTMPTLEVAEALAALGADPARAALDRLLGVGVGAATAEQVDTALGVLRAHALLGPHPGLRLTDAATRVWGRPLGLGPAAGTLVSAVGVDDLRVVARNLGLKGPARKADLVAALVAALGDADLVRALVADAPPPARDLLLEVAAAGRPVPSYDHFSPRYSRAPVESPTRWAQARGLLVPAGQWGSELEMPSEVALALRGPGWTAPFTPLAPEPTRVAVAAATVDSAGSAAAAGALRLVTGLLDAGSRTPVAGLKNGGVGVREVRRLAKALVTSTAGTPGPRPGRRGGPAGLHRRRFRPDGGLRRVGPRRAGRTARRSARGVGVAAVRTAGRRRGRLGPRGSRGGHARVPPAAAGRGRPAARGRRPRRDQVRRARSRRARPGGPVAGAVRPAAARPVGGGAGGVAGGRPAGRHRRRRGDRRGAGPARRRPPFPGRGPGGHRRDAPDRALPGRPDRRRDGRRDRRSGRPAGRGRGPGVGRRRLHVAVQPGQRSLSCWRVRHAPPRERAGLPGEAGPALGFGGRACLIGVSCRPPAPTPSFPGFSTSWVGTGGRVTGPGDRHGCRRSVGCSAGRPRRQAVPNRIHVTVGRQRRFRRASGTDYVVHHEDLAADRVGWWQEIPTVTPATAISQCLVYGTPTHLLRQAIERGHAQGYLKTAERGDLGRALEARNDR